MTIEEKNRTNKKTAKIVGVLFIIATVTAIISVALLESVLTNPDYLVTFSANETSSAFPAIHAYWYSVPFWPNRNALIPEWRWQQPQFPCW